MDQFQTQTDAGRDFTLQTFKEILLKRFPDLNNISTSTLSRCFRNKIRMSYKKRSRFERRMKTPESKIEFMKWSALISSLAVLDKNTLFVDEFKISSKSNCRFVEHLVPCGVAKQALNLVQLLHLMQMERSIF